MNLLGLLLASMTSQSSVGQVSGKTGLSKEQIRKLMFIAIPILLKYMTKNASSGSGAHSLLGALSQHTNKQDMALQLKDADEKDGGKIISHILGKKEPEVTQQISAQSGLTAEQVNQILAIMAPALMSGVSEAASGATVSQQNTAQASPSFMPGAAPGIFSALLGTSPSTQIQEVSQEDNSAINGVALLQALLNARK